MKAAIFKGVKQMACEEHANRPSSMGEMHHPRGTRMRVRIRPVVLPRRQQGTQHSGRT